MSNLVVCIWKVELQLSETRDCVPKEFLHGPGLLTLQTRSRSCPQSLGCDPQIMFYADCVQTIPDHLDTVTI